VIPAALFAIGGAMSAVLGIFAPEIKGIVAGVQALDAIAKAKRASKTDPQGRQQEQQVADAEERLRRVRQDNAFQERDAEESLHDLRLRNKEQEADAERRLRRDRQDAADSLLRAEERLASLRAQNNQTRAEL